MTAKEFLSQTWRINRQILAKLEQVRELRELATKASSTLSDTPFRGTQNAHRMEDIIAKILYLENETKSEIDELLTRKQNISSAIKGVSNPDHRILLERRYLAFKSWSEIAEDMRYSQDYIFTLHRKALFALSVTVKGVEKQ